MATFEEKILAYLDGSLPEAEREDLLAGISGADGRTLPDEDVRATSGVADATKRELFDAHLRLQKLYTLAQKPVSAPLALQRELASKIPVLAVKLPYLAPPVNRRERMTAGWFSSNRVNALLVAAVMLLAGGVWYFAANGNSASHASSANNSSSANKTPSAVQGSSLNNSASSVAKPIPNTNDMGNISEHASSPNANAHSSNAGHNLFSSTEPQHGKLSLDASRANLANLQRTTSTPMARANRSAKSEEIVSNSHSTQIANNSQANAPEPALPALELHAVDARASAIMVHPIASIISPLAIDDNSSDSPRWHVYETQGVRFISAPALTSYVIEKQIEITSSRIVPSFEGGAEYEITPQTALGIRIGQTRFEQYQPITYPSTNLLEQQVSDYDVISAPAFWFAISATETFNPDDRMQYSLSVAGGPALTTPLGWLGIAEAIASYDITPSWVLRGGVSFDLSRIGPSPGSTNASHDSTIGFSTASSVNTLTSRALGITLGLSFHP